MSDAPSGRDTTCKDCSGTGRIGGFWGLWTRPCHVCASFEELVEALKDRREKVCTVAATTLGKRGDLRAVEPLIEVIGERIIRCEVAKALAELGDPRAVEPLIEVLFSDGAYAPVVIDSLAELGDRRAVEPLIKILLDAERSDITRAAAARVLGGLGDPRAVEPLMEARDSNTLFASDAAAKALKKLPKPAGTRRKRSSEDDDVHDEAMRLMRGMFGGLPVTDAPDGDESGLDLEQDSLDDEGGSTKEAAELKRHTVDELHEEMEQRNFLETVPGQILTNIKKLYEGSDTNINVQEMGFGLFQYEVGTETAVLQIHIDNGVGRYYTPMLDLQKSWWKKAFLDQQMNGDINRVGLISPPIKDLLIIHGDPNVANKFSHNNLFPAAGISDIEFGEEYSENDVYNASEEAEQLPLLLKVADFLNPIVSPHFEVKFDNGNGSLWRRLRLRPLTGTGSTALISGNDLFKEVIRKMVENYDQLIEHLKKQK